LASQHSRKTLHFKLGKTPARKGAVRFKLATYLKKHELATPPKVFGRQAIVGNWGILGNKKYLDCVWAGAAHETMLWNKEAHRIVRFNDKGVLSDYSAVTGFKKGDPISDIGTDSQVAASYRRRIGVIDANRKRHKLVAYLALTPGNVEQLILSMYLFSAVGIGLKLPKTALAQFQRGKPWDVVPGAKPIGGHYVPGVGRSLKGNIVVVSWGRTQLMTPRFYRKYCDEAIAYLSEEMLVPPVRRSLDGLNLAQLMADLKTL
jgi:hypothetical protein